MVLPNGFTFFDQDSMVGIASAPLESLVLQQNPDPGSHVFCGDHKLQLVVDLAAPMVTTSLPLQTTPTVLPSEPGATTTTSVKPKATTTTSP
jgi:hypothetical protein